MIKFCILYTIFLTIHAQHWWDFDDLENPNEQPLFTPRPNMRYTHDSRKNQLATQPNDVMVNIPKAGHGSYVGFTQRVNYDYTWTAWPPEHGRLLNVFLGIPYAAPPIGDLRFMRPIPSYLDTRFMWYAKRYKSACIQQKEFLQKTIINFDDFSEDCLYLNIFSPNRTWESPDILYPVVIHIHGGSFTMGSSHLYPGHALASNGVVVVTFNYRLGPFGFLATGDFEAMGNYGLWDQLMAIQWVKDNIRWFRGDDTKITLMGESAGAASVGLHLVSPVTGMSRQWNSNSKKDRANNLFHQAVMMSGSDLSQWAISDPDNIKTRIYVDQLAKSLNCYYYQMNIEIRCLRYYKDPFALSQAANHLKHFPGGPTQIWSPVVDGTAGFMPRNPRILRKQGRMVQMPFLATVVHSEASWLVKSNIQKYLNKSITDTIDESDMRIITEQLVRNTNAYRVNDSIEELQLRYTWWSNLANETARIDELVHMYSDYFIKAPIYETLLTQADNSSGTNINNVNNIFFGEWAYRPLNDTQPKQLGIYHGIDLKFLFGFPFMNKTFNDELYGKNLQFKDIHVTWNYPYDTNMSEFAMILWSNFIKLGDPTPYEIRNVTWLPFEIKNDQYYIHMYINSSIHKYYRQDHLAFWRERYNYLAQPLPDLWIDT